MATPEEMTATMVANMPEKTGNTLVSWLAIVSASGQEKHGQIVKMLKTDHGMTHGFANMAAHHALNLASTGDDDLIASQYSGKESLKPVHDAVRDYAVSLGDDVEVAPKKTSVSLRRSKQFALITPAAKTCIDLGLALKGEQSKGRLETYNTMCSHRIRLKTRDDFDDEVKRWMKLAYERA